jgi:hypothetical protein
MSRAAFKLAKTDGLTAVEVWSIVERSINERAKQDGWRPAEQAATLADEAFSLREVFGKRATKFLFEDRGT